jgi:hypothetical protein
MPLLDKLKAFDRASKKDIFDRVLESASYEPLTLSPEQERAFKFKFVNSPWYKNFVESYGEVPVLPEHGGDYDYRRAVLSGALNLDKPGSHGHSRSSKGEWLKNPKTHPTAWMELFYEATGEDPSEMSRKDAAKIFEKLRNKRNIKK